MTCTYDFKGPNGEAIRLTGKPALKSFLANGGLQFLLPDRAASMPAFRRTAVQAATSPEVRERVAMVQRMADGINERMANPPKVEVFTSMQDAVIPEKVRARDQEQRDGGAKGEVGGFYLGGTVYLNASQLATPQQAATAYAHETLGHYGLRGLFGTALNPVLEQIIALRKKDVAAKVNEYGGDVNDPAHMLEAAEEVLAVMAQNTPNNGFVKRAVAAIHTWLRRNVPGFASLQLTDGEIIRDYILPARAFVEQGASIGKSLANDADIRFLRAPDAKTADDTSLKPAEQSMLRKLQAQFQDSNNIIKGIQKRIETLTGAKIPEWADYYMAEENRPGRIAARLEDFRNQMQAPLIERIVKSGHTMAQVEELAHGMHALERNKLVAKINPKYNVDSSAFEGSEGSGMSSVVAQAIQDKYSADTNLHKHVTDLQAIARAGLDMKRAAGMLTEEQYTAYTSAYKYYVPLKGEGEFGPQIKRAMGHDAREEHILENVMRDYEQAVTSTERNIARMPLLQLMLENPDSTLWDVGIAPKGRYVAGQVYSIMKNGEEVALFTSQLQVDAFLEGQGNQAATFEVFDGQGDRVKEFTKPIQENEVVVYIDGQRVRMQIKPEDLARQLRPLNQEQMNVVLSVFRDVLRYLSRIYTAYSPTFIITNPLRDVQTGTVTMLANQGAELTAKAWAAYPAAMKALGHYASIGTEPQTEAGAMLKEYRMSGGKTGASHMSDLDEQGKTLQRLFDDAYGAAGYLADGKPGKAAIIAGRKMLLGMAHVIEVANQATENGLRLALYTALRNDGTSPGKAAQAAKNVTVNFDRKGSQTGVMSALYLFFNPAVQGTANAFRAISKGDTKQQAWAALAGLTLLGMFAAGQGLDDDKDRWLGEGWGDRSKRLVLNIGGHRISVPLSMEFSPFYSVGVALEEARRGAVSKGETFGQIVTAFIDAYVPFKGLFSYDSDNMPLDAATAMVPTVLRPAMEAATNRNVFGSKIVPESDFTKDRPDNLKMNRNTKGTVFDSASQGLASVGGALGAGRYENDISKVSPEMLKHWWRTYTGGLGSFVGDMASLAKIAAEDAGSVVLADVPVAKSFVVGQGIRPIRGRYYDLAREARAAITEFDQAKKAADGAAMDAIIENPTKKVLIGLGDVIMRTNKAVGAIRNEMVDVNADTVMTLPEKRAKLKELEKIEEVIYREGISAFK